MAYKHGIEVTEKATSFPSPLSTQHAVQVVFGTAPVNQAADPAAAINRPIKAATFEEAQEALGYSEDWENYTLCQSMYASFQLAQVGPVIFVNVLDPTTHVKDLEETVCTVKNHQAVLETAGILLEGLSVKVQAEGALTGRALTGEAKTGQEEGVQLEAGTDYLAGFDDHGYLTVTLLSAGAAYSAEELTVSGKA